jgi:hypothetical protein
MQAIRVPTAALLPPSQFADLMTLEQMKASVSDQIRLHSENLKLIDALIEARKAEAKRAEEEAKVRAEQEKEALVKEEKEARELDEKTKDGKSEDGKSEGSRRKMSVSRCPHPDRKHYAKGMCNNCYHKQGRNKLAWLCEHKDRQAYAKGKCQNCYLNEYHRMRRLAKRKATN